MGIFLMRVYKCSERWWAYSITPSLNITPMRPYLIHFAVLYTFLASFGVEIHALSPNYSACQLQQNAETSPLTGCPDGTLFVSPTDSRARFKTVQAAVESLWVPVRICPVPCLDIHRPETGDAIILIGAGEYFEKVTVTRSAPLTLLVFVILFVKFKYQDISV